MKDMLKRIEQIRTEILQNARATLTGLDQKADTLLEAVQGDPDRAILAQAGRNVADAYRWSVKSLEERIEGGPSVAYETKILSDLSELLLESTDMINEALICNM